MVPEVKQLWREDGRCKEPQEEENTGGQVLHILPKEWQVRGPEAHGPAGETEAAKTRDGGAQGSGMEMGREVACLSFSS